MDKAKKAEAPVLYNPVLFMVFTKIPADNINVQIHEIFYFSLHQ